MDTLTAASTVVTPSQSNAPNENFLQHQITTTTATSIMSHQQQINNNTVSGSISMPLTPASSTTPLGLGLGLSSNKMSRALYAHKLRTHTNKLKQQTNKIMSNLKGKNIGDTKSSTAEVGDMSNILIST